MAARRRAYGEGSIYQRASDGRWVGSFERGWTSDGKRRRVVVTAKTRAEVAKKLTRKRNEIDRYGDSGWSDRTTVKQWVETYLERRMLPPKPLSPKGWKAAAQPMRRWVIPTIGHRRVVDLTPGDIRKVAKAQYDANLSTSTADATQRAFMTCLRAAKADGAGIADNVFLVARPGMAKSDRVPLTLMESLRCLAVASTMPHGIRWALALLYGVRQGEALGLVDVDPISGEPCVDFDQHVIRLSWQLQQIDYKDPKRKHLGFKLPRDYEAVHLHGRYHLTRPKSQAGVRVLPMIEPVEKALKEWMDARPANSWGLVFPDAEGLPVDDKVDREEWHAIQYTASMEAAEAGEYAAPLDQPPVFHPSGTRFYHIHECRNVAATELDEVGASELVVTSMLGHTSITTSRRYQRANLEPKRAAIEAVAARFGLS